MKTAQRVALVTCLATLLLVAIGALVRATGSGLGCPDWPLCHGGVVPPGDQGHQPLIEFTHRFAAASVGLLVIATAIFAWRYFRHAPVVAWVAVLTVPMVGLQGLLGAITVWRELPAEIVATHLLTAMVILSMEAVVVVGMYRAGTEAPGWVARAGSALASRLGSLSLATLAWFAVLLWVGGYMAESGASTACEGWPLCNGAPLPAADDQEIVHMIHRYLAAGLALPLGALVVALWRNRGHVRWMAPLALTSAGLYGTQVVVGALNVWLTFPDTLTVSHTAIAGALWLTVSTAAVLALYEPRTVAIAHDQPVEAAPA